MPVYTLTREPSRYWADVWRKPGAAGAAYLQSGVAALPDDPAGDARRGARALGGRGNGVPLPGLFGRPPGEPEETLRGTRDAGQREVSGRRRDSQAESSGERGADNPGLAEPEEKAEDLVKQEARVSKIRTDDRFGAPLMNLEERRQRTGRLRVPTSLTVGLGVVAARARLDAFV